MSKTSSYRWNYPKQNDAITARDLAKDWQTNEVIAMLMHRRQLHSKDALKTFFKPSFQNLHDPFDMKDMATAVNRLSLAIQNNEHIVFFGDYDVDGTTSVALMKSFFSSRYAHFFTYIPDRYKEGYGLSKDGIDWAISKGCSLMITLDCGIKSVSLVEYAQNKGLDIIICDHHTPGETLPPAIAVLDPKRSDCNYPFKELSGCGVGFKLLCAYAKKNAIAIDEVLEHLDLLALSIGADIVPIVGENRILAHYGMQRIKLNPCMGIAALTKIAKRQIRTIDDVVFTIAPRINAAGRMAHGSEAVELLSTKNLKTAEKLARELDALNLQRRSTDQHITKEAIDIIASRLNPDAASTVVYSEDWHKGVIGIVASRLVERFYRPTIVLTKSNGVYAGSARSVEGFDLYQALEKCENELIQFGGHMYAAGMTVKAENIQDFAERFESVVCALITPEQKIPQLNIDAILPFSLIDDTLTNTLTRMQPFGPQNMKPIFVTRHLILGDGTRCVGSDNSHLKIEVIDPETGESRMGIAFGWGEKLEALKTAERLHLAYHLDENVWNGKSQWQLHVLDIDY
ncbi:MAG: single-stranded-DNA-specific exonuclease RecJ [Cryomorphaceae bacterium]|nr:single-stranded-DNA-specific exonuclease RecJ [Cryomorphaceae bacterium]